MPLGIVEEAALASVPPITSDISASPPQGLVTFQPVPPEVFGVTAWLSGSWTVNAGDGQIERVSVDRRTARTVWTGRAPITMQGSILISGGIRRLSVERACRNLDAMMGRGRSGTPREPMDLRIDANGMVAYDARWYPDVRWWLEGVEWDDEAVGRRGDNHRVWQAAKVQLVQIVRPDTAFQASGAAAARDVLQRDSQNTHKVRQGETLRGIARRYGVSWEDIARLNGLSHPGAAPRGRVLRLPSA